MGLLIQQNIDLKIIASHENLPVNLLSSNVIETLCRIANQQGSSINDVTLHGKEGVKKNGDLV